MGRAIVREPKAFLMDEPLSNLDAKLRVGMRASLAQLHARLGVTTVYVTHDQTEAMTLGQRVAVMRDGRVLQVDTPQRLYSGPVDLFVAGFIGTPAMNLVEARLDGERGRLRLPTACRSTRRGARRPATDASCSGSGPRRSRRPAFARPGLPTLDATVTVLEELGADAHVFFLVDAAPAGDAKATGADGRAARRRGHALHGAGRPAHDGPRRRSRSRSPSTRPASTSSTRRPAAASSAQLRAARSRQRASSSRS